MRSAIQPRGYLETTMFNFPFADDAPHYKADTLAVFGMIRAGKIAPYTSLYTVAELEATKSEFHRDRMQYTIWTSS